VAAASILNEVTEDIENIGAGDIPTVIELVNRVSEHHRYRI
jgi:hypothetical protein